jgi:hypothetical protein
MSAKLLTKQNLDEGFVIVPVKLLSGETLELRLMAPTWRKRRELILRFQQELDTFVFMAGCLEETLGSRAALETLLNKLDPDSLARAESYAVAMVLGEEYQKKMAAAGKELLEKLETSTSPGSEPNARPPEASAGKSRAGRGRG